MTADISLQPDLNSTIYRRILENLYDGVYFINLESRIIYWNKGAERITGKPKREMYGILLGSDRFQQFNEEGIPLDGNKCPLLATLYDCQAREAEVYLRHVEGYLFPALVKTLPVHDGERRLTGAMEIFSDNPILLRSRLREKSLDQTTSYDPLTQIGGRKHLERKLNSALIDTLQDGSSIGVLFIDIDHFKNFNDTHGHIAGDKALRTVANTLRHNLRDSDTCGRWGGEEFLVILFDINTRQLELIAEKLRLLVASAVVEINKQPHHVTISIGGTIAQPEEPMESLIHRADKLMYQSKKSGRNRITIG